MEYGIYYRTNSGRPCYIEFENTELLELLNGGLRKAEGNESMPNMKKLVQQILENGSFPDEY